MGAAPGFPRSQAATPSPSPATQLHLIEAYLQTRQTAKALALARSLSQKAPQDARLHFSLGTLLASAKQYKAAIHELETADALQPGTFEILHNLGEAYLSGGNNAKADATLHHALALKPDSVSTMYLEAQALTREKKALDAFQLLFHARKLAPKNTDIILLLARLSMQQSYYEDAIPLLEEGIKLAPRRPDLRAALGESYYSAGKAQKAYQQFKALLELDPSVTSYAFMGLYYRHQGQFDEASKYFKEGLQKDPRNADCLYNLGLIADKQGHYLEAGKFLTQALKSNPNHGDALFELATVRMEQKKFAEAIPLLRRCVQLDPDQSKAYYKLAVAERNLGQNQAAEADMKVFETLAKNPSPGPMPFRHFMKSASHKASLPPAQQAQLDLEELAREIKQHPDRPRSFYLEAEAYLKLGQIPQARQALMHLRQISSGDVRTMTGAGVLLARYKLYPDAIQYFELALKADSDSDDAKYDLADAYFETRNYTRALQWLDAISPRGQNDAATLALRGDTEAHVGNLAGAASSFEKAVQKSPDDDRYYLSLAFVEMRAGNLAAAGGTLRRGLTRIPDSGRILWGMGVLAVARADNQHAEGDFRRALDLLPEWENCYSALGTFYFDTGQINKAQETLERYAKIFPHGDLNVNGLRQVLSRASQEQTAGPAPLSQQARLQFVGMALALAERHP
ncbi:MAG TPA: tetratricopeptide repeat protein [Terriglobia bacterium]|nr:tetratricopeptide repeat protein [Terriglobia bacterium]